MKMVSSNKFWTCVFMMYALAVSFCVYAESNKSASKKQPKYEVKSDIINFDYSQLAYPSEEVGLGFKTDTARVPKKIVPAREPQAEKVSPLTVLFDACCLTFRVLVLVSFCFATMTYFPAVLIEVFLLIRRGVINYRKEKKKINKN